MGAIDTVFFSILKVLDYGFVYLIFPLSGLFALFAGFALTRLGFQWLSGVTDNMMGDLINLLVMFAMFTAIGFTAKSIVDGAGNFALNIGTEIVGAADMDEKSFAPGSLWKIGDREASKVLETKNAMCDGTFDCVPVLPDLIMLELGALAIYIAFACLILEMAVTAINYKFHGLFMMLFTPMAVFPPARNLSEGAIQGWLNALIKLTVIAMVAGIGNNAFEHLDMPPKPVFEQIVPAVLMAVFVAWLAWQAGTIASSITSASPRLSGASLSRGAANAVGMVTGGVGAATALRGFGNAESGSLGSGMRELAQGAGRVPGRMQAASSAIRQGNYWQQMKQGMRNKASSFANQNPSTGSGGGQSSWTGPPTAKQQYTAQRHGVGLGGMNRAQASQALEKVGAGRMPPEARRYI